MILLDSNIVIYAAEPGYKKLREWLRNQSISISELTKLEVPGYHRITDDKFEWFTGFFDSIESIPISTDIIEAAIPLRRQKSHFARKIRNVSKRHCGSLF